MQSRGTLTFQSLTFDTMPRKTPFCIVFRCPHVDEANRNLKEMSEVLDDEHIKEVEELIQLVQLEEEWCDECILDEE